MTPTPTDKRTSSHIFAIDDETEIHALIRVILAAKFSENVDDPDVPASRSVAAMSRRLAEEIIARAPERSQWFAIDDSRREWRVALQHAVARRTWWKNANEEQRAQFTATLLAPFILDEATTKRFEMQAERAIHDGSLYQVWADVTGRKLVTKRTERLHTIVFAADGATELYRSSDETEATEWLATRGYRWIASGLDDSNTKSPWAGTEHGTNVDD